MCIRDREIREYKNALKADKSEVQKKQEEEVNENYEDTKKVQDTDNTVDLTDVSDTKKLSTVRSNVSSRNKWIKKKNDFVPWYTRKWEEDDPDMDRDCKHLLLPSRMHKKYKLINTGRGTASVNPMMKYPACLLYTSRCV